MERLSSKINTKEIVNCLMSSFRRSLLEIEFDLFELSKPIRFPISPNMDLETEKTRINHLPECWIGNSRVMLRDSSRLDMVAVGYTVNHFRRRVIQLECQFCEGCSPDLLQNLNMDNPMRNSLINLANFRKVQIRQDFLKNHNEK